MDFEQFKEELASSVKEIMYSKYGMEVEVEARTMEKMNSSYEALTVKPEDSIIGVNLNATALYQQYEKGIDIDVITSKAAELAESALNSRPDFDIDSFKDYSKMKETLTMEVVSAERNAALLETVPHRIMEDMAVVYRFEVNTTTTERGSILVTNQMLDQYGITAEQLHADALIHAPEVKPIVIEGMAQVLAKQMGVEDLEMLGLNIPPEQEQIFVASVEGNVHGAGVIAYQDFMEKASERVGGEEALALSWTDSIDMENRIVHVNRSFSDRPDEFGECKKRIQTTKTDAGTRDIPMVQEVFDAFLMEYEFQKILGFCNEEIDGFKDFIFISSNQNVLLPGAVNRAIHSAVDWYNEHEVAAAADEGREPFLLPEEITCHILRHTFCTRLCENESNIKVIQSLMGHRDITTTMNIYADATKEKKQEIMAHLEGKIII